MNKRWWVSYASEATGKNIGVILTTTGDSEAEVLKHLTDLGVAPKGEAMQVMVMEMPAYGDNLHADVEWNRFELNKLISKDEMTKRGYGTIKTHELIERGHEVNVICSDCAK